MKYFDSFTLRKFPTPKGQLRELVSLAVQGIGLASSASDATGDVLYIVLIERDFISRENVSKKVRELRQQQKESAFGESTIRRALKILCDAGFVERVAAKYRMVQAPLPELFDRYIQNRVTPLVERNKEYFEQISLLNSK